MAFRIVSGIKDIRYELFVQQACHILRGDNISFGKESRSFFLTRRAESNSPSRAAGRSIVPTILLRHSKSSGLTTITSLETGISCNATAISIAFSRRDPATGITISRSTSLSSPACPRACEPKRMILSGWNCFAMISTICWIYLLIGFRTPVIYNSPSGKPLPF